MGNKTYKDYFHTEESYRKNKIRVDKKIETYTARCMNNSKWKKLFLTIFSNIHFIKHCEIMDFFSGSIITLKTNSGNIEPGKYIYNDCVDNFLFETGEYAVSYREISGVQEALERQSARKTGRF
jgi:hypothetical protein